MIASDRKPLSVADRATIYAILDLQQRLGRPPTMRELGRRLLMTQGGVKLRSDALVAKGALVVEGSRLKGQMRMLVADRIAEPLPD